MIIILELELDPWNLEEEKVLKLQPSDVSVILYAAIGYAWWAILVHKFLQVKTEPDYLFVLVFTCYSI